jgi:hypothetical protein
MKGMVHGITSESAVMNVRRAIFAIPGKMGMSMSSATGAVQAMGAVHDAMSGAGATGIGAMSGVASTGSDGMSAGRVVGATSDGMSAAAGIGSGGRSGGRVDHATSGGMSGVAGTGSGARSGGRMDRATSDGMSGVAGTGSGARSGGRVDRATSDGMSGVAGTGSGARSGAGIVENDAMIAARGGFRAMIALRHILSRKKRSKRDASRWNCAAG